MHHYLSVLTWSAAAVLAMMFVVWLISVWRRNASLIDIFWSLGFVVVSGIAFNSSTVEATPRRWLVMALVTVWALRLALHIFLRGLGEGEDRRYAAMRQRAGDGFWWKSFFTVFCLQGVLILIISQPLVWIQLAPQEANWQRSDALALLLWCLGFVFEAGGDWQLSRFKADPANQGKVMNQGLWGLTRHPNYFGDFTLWWGYFLFTWAVSGGMWTMGSVVLMSFLLMKVSGVTLLEKDISERRPGYRQYIESTPAFFPRWTWGKG